MDLCHWFIAIMTLSVISTFILVGWEMLSVHRQHKSRKMEDERWSRR